MATKTSLRLIARRISKAVQAAASKPGLLPGDYTLVGSYDEKTERISLTMGIDRAIDELQLYKDVFQEFRHSFPDSPQITTHVGLVIQKVQNLDEVYIDHVSGEDEIDMTEMLDRT